MKFYCNECNESFLIDYLNKNEMEEIDESLNLSGVPSFVCSSCINKEMLGGKE